MRIAHLTTVDMSLALLLSTELQVDVDSGHEVFGLSAPGPYVDRVEQLGVRHVPIRSLTRQWNLSGDLKAFVELIRTLRRLQLDVLHTHNPKTGVMGRIAGRLTGIPVVVNTCHGLWARPEDPWKKRAFVIGMEAFAARFSDFELFQNAQDAATLRRFVKKDRWRVVGNGVDLSRFVNDPEGRRRVRAELGVADDEILVGTIGRRVREKGLAEYAEAAAALGDRASFVWVGPEDDTDTEAIVPAQDAIHFVAERTDMPAVYSALDIFVLASYREGFSRASMEAAACGKPMVLTDIRGCREIGTHDEHLLLVEPHSGAALTAGIDRLLSDQALRARLGEAARARAHREFDQRIVASVSLETYAAIGERRGLTASVAAKPAADRLRVLHLVPHDQNRGAQVYAGQLRDALRDDPDQEHLLAAVFAGQPGAARPDVTLDVPSGPVRRLLDLRGVLRLRRLIRVGGFDAVVAHGGEPLKYAIAAASRLPVIYYKVGLSSAELSQPGRRRLYAELAKRCAHVVAVSTAVGEQVVEELGVPQGRLSIIPNGRDPGRYYPKAADESTEVPTILWVGHFEPGKRPELFIESVRQLRAARAQFRFRAAMAGDGPLRTMLEKSAESADVVLLGVSTNVPDLMRRATTVVMTSARSTEGMPGVLIEAALSGLPTISTPAAGVSDVIKPGVTGLIVEDDPVSIAQAIAVLLTDHAHREQMGAAARQYAVEHFSMTATTNHWHNLVDSLSDPPKGVPA